MKKWHAGCFVRFVTSLRTPRRAFIAAAAFSPLAAPAVLARGVNTRPAAKAPPPLAFPDGFPNQGGLPIRVDGQILGGIGVSGAPSEVDEAIGQVAIDALMAK